jgi:cell wall-associated NlpC family hydrolase
MPLDPGSGGNTPAPRENPTPVVEQAPAAKAPAQSPQSPQSPPTSSAPGGNPAVAVPAGIRIRNFVAGYGKATGCIPSAIKIKTVLNDPSTASYSPAQFASLYRVGGTPVDNHLSLGKLASTGTPIAPTPEAIAAAAKHDAAAKEAWADWANKWAVVAARNAKSKGITNPKTRSPGGTGDIDDFRYYGALSKYLAYEDEGVKAALPKCPVETAKALIATSQAQVAGNLGVAAKASALGQRIAALPAQQPRANETATPTPAVTPAKVQAPAPVTTPRTLVSLTGGNGPIYSPQAVTADLMHKGDLPWHDTVNTPDTGTTPTYDSMQTFGVGDYLNHVTQAQADPTMNGGRSRGAALVNAAATAVQSMLPGNHTGTAILWDPKKVADTADMLQGKNVPAVGTDAYQQWSTTKEQLTSWVIDRGKELGIVVNGADPKEVATVWKMMVVGNAMPQFALGLGGKANAAENAEAQKTAAQAIAAVANGTPLASAALLAQANIGDPQMVQLLFTEGQAGRPSYMTMDQYTSWYGHTYGVDMLPPDKQVEFSDQNNYLQKFMHDAAAAAGDTVGADYRYAKALPYVGPVIAGGVEVMAQPVHLVGGGLSKVTNWGMQSLQKPVLCEQALYHYDLAHGIDPYSVKGGLQTGGKGMSTTASGAALMAARTPKQVADDERKEWLWDQKHGVEWKLPFQEYQQAWLNNPNFSDMVHLAGAEQGGFFDPATHPGNCELADFVVQAGAFAAIGQFQDIGLEAAGEAGFAAARSVAGSLGYGVVEDLPEGVATADEFASAPMDAALIERTGAAHGLDPEDTADIIARSKTNGEATGRIRAMSPEGARPTSYAYKSYLHDAGVSTVPAKPFPWLLRNVAEHIAETNPVTEAGMPIGDSAIAEFLDLPSQGNPEACRPMSAIVHDMRMTNDPGDVEELMTELHDQHQVSLSDAGAHQLIRATKLYSYTNGSIAHIMNTAANMITMMPKAGAVNLERSPEHDFRNLVYATKGGVGKDVLPADYTDFEPDLDAMFRGATRTDKMNAGDRIWDRIYHNMANQKGHLYSDPDWEKLSLEQRKELAMENSGYGKWHMGHLDKTAQYMLENNRNAYQEFSVRDEHGKVTPNGVNPVDTHPAVGEDERLNGAAELARSQLKQILSDPQHNADEVQLAEMAAQKADEEWQGFSRASHMHTGTLSPEDQEWYVKHGFVDGSGNFDAKAAMTDADHKLDAISHREPFALSQMMEGYKHPVNPISLSRFMRSGMSRYTEDIQTKLHMNDLMMAYKEIVLSKFGFPAKVLFGDEYMRLLPEGTATRAVKQFLMTGRSTRTQAIRDGLLAGGRVHPGISLRVDRAIEKIHRMPDVDDQNAAFDKLAAKYGLEDLPDTANAVPHAAPSMDLNADRAGDKLLYHEGRFLRPSRSGQSFREMEDDAGLHPGQAHRIAIADEADGRKGVTITRGNGAKVPVTVRRNISDGLVNSKVVSPEDALHTPHKTAGFDGKIGFETSGEDTGTAKVIKASDHQQSLAHSRGEQAPVKISAVQHRNARRAQLEHFSATNVPDQWVARSLHDNMSMWGGGSNDDYTSVAPGRAGYYEGLNAKAHALHAAREPMMTEYFRARDAGMDDAAAQKSMHDMIFADDEKGYALQQYLHETSKVGAISPFVQGMDEPTQMANWVRDWGDMSRRWYEDPGLNDAFTTGKMSKSEYQKMLSSASEDPTKVTRFDALDPVTVSGDPSTMQGSQFLRRGGEQGSRHVIKPLGKLEDRFVMPFMQGAANVGREMSFSDAFYTIKNSMEREFPGMSPDLMVERAKEYATQYVNRVQYTHNATIFEDGMRNIVPFMPAYRSFYKYWGSQFMHNPLLYSYLYYHDPEDVAKLGWGQYHIWAPAIPWMMQPNPKQRNVGNVIQSNTPVAPFIGIGMRAVNALTGNHLGWTSEIPGLSSVNPNENPAGVLSDLMWGTTGHSLGFLGADGGHMQQMSLAIMKAQISAGMKPDLNAATAQMHGSPWWFRWMEQANILGHHLFPHPEGIEKALTTQFNPGFGEITYDPKNETAWANAQSAFNACKGNKSQEAKVLADPKNDIFAKTQAYFDMGAKDRQAWLADPKNAKYIPYITSTHNYASANELLSGSSRDRAAAMVGYVSNAKFASSVQSKLNNMMKQPDYVGKLATFNEALKANQDRASAIALKACGGNQVQADALMKLFDNPKAIKDAANNTVYQWRGVWSSLGPANGLAFSKELVNQFNAANPKPPEPMSTKMSPVSVTKLRNLEADFVPALRNSLTSGGEFQQEIAADLATTQDKALKQLITGIKNPSDNMDSTDIAALLGKPQSTYVGVDKAIFAYKNQLANIELNNKNGMYAGVTNGYKTAKEVLQLKLDQQLLKLPGGSLLVGGVSSRLLAVPYLATPNLDTALVGPQAKAWGAVNSWMSTNLDPTTTNVNKLWSDAYTLEGKNVNAPAAATKSGSAALAYGMTFKGEPYVYGGSTRTDTDCSGLSMQVYAHFGVQLPHNAMAQYNDPAVTHVSEGDLLPGDLVFFSHGGVAGIHHVGLYAGKNAQGQDLMLDAYATGTNVRVEPVLDSGQPFGYGRVLASPKMSPTLQNVTNPIIQALNTAKKGSGVTHNIDEVARAVYWQNTLRVAQLCHTALFAHGMSSSSAGGKLLSSWLNVIIAQQANSKSGLAFRNDLMHYFGRLDIGETLLRD